MLDAVTVFVGLSVIVGGWRVVVEDMVDVVV